MQHSHCHPRTNAVKRTATHPTKKQTLLTVINKDLTPPSSSRQSRLGLGPCLTEIWNGMPNGTANSRNFQISGENDNLQRLTKIFETNFSKIFVPFDSVPEFPEMLVQWIAPNVSEYKCLVIRFLSLSLVLTDFSQEKILKLTLSMGFLLFFCWCKGIWIGHYVNVIGKASNYFWHADVYFPCFIGDVCTQAMSEMLSVVVTRPWIAYFSKTPWIIFNYLFWNALHNHRLH